jgi:deoxyribose-phosphate aldolase
MDTNFSKTNYDIAKYIDHTLLKPEATESQIRNLCMEAVDNRFYSVCVNSVWVPLCSSLLKNSEVKVCSVIGFPLGAMSSQSKAFETSWCVENGASEIDMVLQLGFLKNNQFEFVASDIQTVVAAAKGKTVKVIFETCLLSHDEKIKACEASLAGGAQFVKTSTGFSTAGATIEDVHLMKRIVGNNAKVKASGGIKNLAQAMAFISAGAERLGTSSGVEILKGLESKQGY